MYYSIIVVLLLYSQLYHNYSDGRLGLPLQLSCPLTEAFCRLMQALIVIFMTRPLTLYPTCRFELASTLVRLWRGWWERRCLDSVSLVTRSTRPVVWSLTGSLAMSTSVKPLTSECTKLQSTGVMLKNLIIMLVASISLPLSISKYTECLE